MSQIGVKSISRAFQQSYVFRFFITSRASYCLNHFNLFQFVFLLSCLALTKGVVSYATSKQIELKSPATSQIKDNFVGFPTVMYLFIFQYCEGNLQIKTFSEFCHNWSSDYKQRLQVCMEWSGGAFEWFLT